MLTLRVACFVTVLAAVASSQDNPPNAALEWQPVKWFVVYLSSALLLLLAMVTCATRRERLDSKGLVGVDLVERGVLEGEQSAGVLERLARRWPWSPAPRRSPRLSHLRAGLARSTQPRLSYQLVEKRHVHLARGALCAIRMDLEELQERAEKENLTKTPRGSTDSGDTSYGSQRGSGSGSLTERLGSVTGNPIIELGTVKPLETKSQALFRKVQPLETSPHRVSWSPSILNITSDSDFLEEGEVREPLPEDIPTDSVVTTGDSTQRHNQISDTDFALDAEHTEKWGTVGETTALSETADTGGRDESQTRITITEDIPADSVVITGTSTQRHNQISDTDFALNAEHTEKWGTVGKTTALSETADTGGRDESQTRITITEDMPMHSVVITGDSTQRHNQISDTDFALDADHMEKSGTVGESTALGETSDTGGRNESQTRITVTEDMPMHSVVITGDSSQSHNQIRETDFAVDAKHTEKWGTAGGTTALSETADTGGRDESQTRITITREITQTSDDVTVPENIIKVRSHFDVHGEGGGKSEPTISDEDTQAKRDLLPQHKMKSASDLEESSESDVLDEISGSSDDLPPYLPLRNQSQEEDFMLDDNTELESEFKTARYIYNPTGDPESSPSQEEVSTAIDNTITKSPSVYMTVLGKDAANLPKHKLPKEEMEDSDVSSCASSCFLHPTALHSQQEFNKRKSSKSVRFIYLPPEKENSAQQLQYWQQSEYKVAPASVTTINNTAFSARHTPTKWQSAKSSEKSIAADEVPRLPTSWDLLHSFPCHTDTVQMLGLDTASRMSTVSNSYSGLKQHDEHSLYQRSKGDELATKQQKSCNMGGIVSDNRHMCSRAERHTSTARQPPSSYRLAYTPVSYSETETEQQCHPLNAGEHHKVFQWRITFSPHPTRSSNREHLNSRPEGE